MKRVSYALAIFVAMIVKTNAAAPDFEPVGPVHVFNFDTADGYFEAWDDQIVCPVNAIRATIRQTRYGKPTTEFQAGVNVYLLNGVEPNEQYAKLGFHAMAFRPPFVVMMAAGGRKTKPQKLTFGRQTGAGSFFSFELRWANGGAVHGTVEGQSGAVSMRGSPERIHIMGFSGAGEVRIQLGYFRTRNPKDPCHPMA